MVNRKGQISLFVIIAIVIVGAIVAFFAFRGNLSFGNIPAEFQPVYSSYDECIKGEAENALSLLGVQGGRIDTGEFTPGSDFAPFSSHLNFLGLTVPYWYSISGNNVIKENVPTKSEMEREVSNYIESNLQNCNFDEFYSDGFYIDLGEPSVKTQIEDNLVRVEVSSKVSVVKEDRSAIKNVHEVNVESKIGKFYNLASEIYNKEIKDAFLEDYAIDVMRLYAPVDGVEVQCNPKIWKTQEVAENIKEGLELNIPSIKFDGSYYRLNNESDKYFVVDLGVDEQVNLLYSKDWPSKVEITPAEQELLIADPVGNQQGLGALGFCYVPYHFVYDVSFPVMIQISDGLELFQFPIAVIIDNNLPRQAELTQLSQEGDFDVCEFKNSDVMVSTFDNTLNPVEADISYNCFDQVCDLGKTEVVGDNAVFDGKAPQCLNGYLIAKADGFAEKRVLFSSNNEDVADIFLDREYELEVDLKVGAKNYNGLAIVSFVKENGEVQTVSLPSINKVKLTEGSYNVSVYAYGDSNIVIPKSTRTQCYDVPSGGITGIFGAKKEECFNIEVPETNIGEALIGGGQQNTYILESQLQNGKVTVEVDALPRPSSLEQLQYNYETFNTQGVDLIFT